MKDKDAEKRLGALLKHLENVLAKCFAGISSSLHHSAGSDQAISLGETKQIYKNRLS